MATSEKPHRDVMRFLNALDLPYDLQAIQDAYWDAKREWEKTEAAFERVLEYMLDRKGGS